MPQRSLWRWSRPGNLPELAQYGFFPSGIKQVLAAVCRAAWLGSRMAQQVMGDTGEDAVSLGFGFIPSWSFLSIPRCIPLPRGAQWHFGLAVSWGALKAAAFPSTRMSAHKYQAFKHQGFILCAVRIFCKKRRTFYSAYEIRMEGIKHCLGFFQWDLQEGITCFK